MRCGMVLSGESKGNYAVDHGRSIYENDLRRLAQLQAEYNSLVGSVGKALAEADAQLEAQITEFIQVARQSHTVDAEEEQIRDYLFSTVAEQVPNGHLFRIKNRLSGFCSSMSSGEVKISVQLPRGADETTQRIHLTQTQTSAIVGIGRTARLRLPSAVL